RGGDDALRPGHLNAHTVTNGHPVNGVHVLVDQLDHSLYPPGSPVHDEHPPVGEDRRTFGVPGLEARDEGMTRAGPTASRISSTTWSPCTNLVGLTLIQRPLRAISLTDPPGPMIAASHSS